MLSENWENDIEGIANTLKNEVNGWSRRNAHEF